MENGIYQWCAHITAHLSHALKLDSLRQHRSTSLTWMQAGWTLQNTWDHFIPVLLQGPGSLVCSAWTRVKGDLKAPPSAHEGSKRAGEGIGTRAWGDRQDWGNGLKWKREDLDWICGNSSCEGGESPAQRSPGCPISGSIQGQDGHGFGQSGPVENVPAAGRALDHWQNDPCFCKDWN